MVLTSDNIYNLKKVKEVLSTLSNTFANVDAASFTVWKTMGAMIINKLTVQQLAELLRGIDINDEDTIGQLDEAELVAKLGLSDGQLVRLPGTSRISTTIGCVPIAVMIITRQKQSAMKPGCVPRVFHTASPADLYLNRFPR